MRRNPGPKAYSSGERAAASLMNLSFLSKCLPLFFLPLGAALVMLLAALRWHRKTLIAAPLLLLWIFSLPVISDQVMRSSKIAFLTFRTENAPERTRFSSLVECLVSGTT